MDGFGVFSILISLLALGFVAGTSVSKIYWQDSCLTREVVYFNGKSYQCKSVEVTTKEMPTKKVEAPNDPA